MTNIQDRLKTVREKCGLTQQELAKQLDIPLRTLRTWEQGSRVPLKLTAVGLEVRLKEIETSSNAKLKKSGGRSATRGAS